MDNEKNTANGGENTGKTFTQEEVNQIVSNRLKAEDHRTGNAYECIREAAGKRAAVLSGGCNQLFR